MKPRKFLAPLGFGRSVVCALPVLLFLAAWQLVSDWAGGDVLPGAWELARAFASHAMSDSIIRSQGGGAGGYLPHVAATVMRVAVGVASGATVGIVAALALFQLPRVRRQVEPLLESLRVIPPLILIPFVLVILGPTELAQYVACALYAVLSMFVHALNAVENLPREFWIIAKMHGSTRWHTIKTVAWPASLPELLGGLRITLAIGLGIVVLTEYFGAPDGIGRVLKFSISFARVDLVLVGILWAALIGVAFDVLINKVMLPQVRWRD